MSECKNCATQAGRADKAERLLKAFEAQRDIEIMADTKSIFRGTEVMKRYEAIEAENVHLVRQVQRLEAALAASTGQDPNVCEHGVNTLMSGLCNQCCEETTQEHAPGCKSHVYLDGTQVWGCVAECPTRKESSNDKSGGKND